MATQTSQVPDSQMALELQQLLSPEKALHLVYHLVERNPNLWHDIQDTLNPGQSSSEHSEPSDVVSSVLRNLRALQLTQLPIDTLGVISRFLPLLSCLKLSETCSFFNHFVPQHIDVLHVANEPSAAMRRFFNKCERLRSLSIDGAWKCSQSVPFSLPLTHCKSLRELSLINVRLLEADANSKIDGTFSLKDLELVSCSNLNVAEWLKLSSKNSAPNLRRVALKTRHCLEIEHEDVLQHGADDSMTLFISKLVASPNHCHLKNLSLTVCSGDLNIAASLRSNRGLMANLFRLELGLLDQHSIHRSSVQRISGLFRELLCWDDDECDDSTPRFESLKMLSIDFCPAPNSGDNDISPDDLQCLAQSVPTLFPELRLLALFGSHSPLLFNDEHLDGFLRGNRLDQLIDLSLGFEDMTPHYLFGGGLQRILATCPNLAWLTLQSEHLLTEGGDHQVLQRIVAEAVHGLRGLKWITLCGADQDRIYPISTDNAVNIEFWDRSIEQCDFEAALRRSLQIVRQRG